MVVSEFRNIKISAIAAAVSNNWTALSEISDESPEILKKFTINTGVEGRYNAGPRQTTADFCYAAAKEILLKRNIDTKEIGVLVFVTQTSDYGIPATACVLQKRLGLSNDCIVFDVNLGCSGYSYGLNIVASLLQCSNSKMGLLLAGDTSAKEKNPLKKSKSTRSANLLFGDSGTATLICKEDGAKSIKCVSKTDGEGYKAIISPYGGWRNPCIPEGCRGSSMDDLEVFDFSTREVPVILKETMDLTGTKVEDYDCLVLHQANLFILKRIAKLAKFPMDKVLISIDKFANTSSSSLPITLVGKYGCEEADRELHTLMCGFGVGLSWSTADCYVNVKDILPLVHTDEYFDDGYTLCD